MSDAPTRMNYVLLANSRPDKGFDLILDVAERLPNVSFVTIANQKSIEAGIAQIDSRGLKNVEIISKVEDMTPLYLGAHVVAVPSYQFKETFGRVPIEAHRFGKPVIGSTEGNVPYLLTESGIVLPEDADAWATEISRLYDDPEYYAQCVQRAHENAIRYSAARQRDAQRNVFDFMRKPVLVGVGSGIGNLLHCGPMLTAIARHIGAPVDVVVAEDYSGSLFLLQRDGIVNAVHRMGPALLERYYDTVFLSHCFGSARMRFNSPNVLYSRDWNMFRPGETSHESLFNLEAVEAMMGVPYDPATFANDYYVSNINHTWTQGRVIGIHGGSKPGYWSSKRWTGFEELVPRLTAEGWELRSFGVADEYVEGAQDYTGGTIEEMVSEIRACNYFISNDSGVMNIAHALGIPVLSLFAPTDVATRAPLRSNCISLSAQRDCTPCEVTDIERFRSGECKCISDISVEDVMQAFRHLCQD
ncbi:glycosyltransferase (plasmid) [Sulfitobacter sp. S223]|uniref:glycosyltransferase n=1 Tax=Sulfitobacter sp. S223 TaxID=2867023 RepID=UPI0021A97347|nr:glycosyltransferase [Sulfitobacter sp. S223]UWR28374.1 glycosyltransferase [Sulfitobacter sp. S223]